MLKIEQDWKEKEVKAVRPKVFTFKWMFEHLLIKEWSVIIGILLTTFLFGYSVSGFINTHYEKQINI